MSFGQVLDSCSLVETMVQLLAQGTQGFHDPKLTDSWPDHLRAIKSSVNGRWKYEMMIIEIFFRLESKTNHLSNKEMWIRIRQSQATPI